MKEKIFLIFIVTIMCCTFLTGCDKSDEKETLIFSDEKSTHNYAEIYKFDDGRVVYSEFANLQFRMNSGEIINLSDGLKNELISINDIIQQMNYIDSFNDGGSKLYSYDKNNSDFANTDFYLVQCHAVIGYDSDNNALFSENVIIGTSKDIAEKCR
mgnify:CR=1 FL=1